MSNSRKDKLTQSEPTLRPKSPLLGEGTYTGTLTSDRNLFCRRCDADTKVILGALVKSEGSKDTYNAKFKMKGRETNPTECVLSNLEVEGQVTINHETQEVTATGSLPEKIPFIGGTKVRTTMPVKKDENGTLNASTSLAGFNLHGTLEKAGKKLEKDSKQFEAKMEKIGHQIKDAVLPGSADDSSYFPPHHNPFKW